MTEIFFAWVSRSENLAMAGFGLFLCVSVVFFLTRRRSDQAAVSALLSAQTEMQGRIQTLAEMLDRRQSENR